MFQPIRMNAAETSASSAIADWTPLTVVCRSWTTYEIETFHERGVDDQDEHRHRDEDGQLGTARRLLRDGGVDGAFAHPCIPASQ
jgi:hypothetical protein